MTVKKLLKATLILACAGWVHADIAVTPGVGKTVHTDTANSLEYQYVKIADGTTAGTSSMTVTSAGAALATVIQSTVGIVGSISNTGFNVNNTPAVTQSGTWILSQSTVGVVNGGTTFLTTVVGSSVGIVNGSASAITTVSTYTVISATYSIPVSGSFSVNGSTLAVSNVSGTLLNTAVFQSTVGVVNGGTTFLATVVGSSVGIVNGSASAITTVSTYTVVSSTYSIPVTGTFSLIVATVGVVQGGTPLTVVSTGMATNITQINGNTVATGASGIMKVALTDGSGNAIASASSALATLDTQTGVWTITSTQTVVNSTSSLPIGVLVASTTFANAASQGSTITLRSDSLGRVLVSGVPYSIIVDTWNVSIATGTNDLVIVSSPTAPTKTFLCGIMCYNTSATNSGFVIYQSSSNANNGHPVGAPANDVPFGIWPGCSQPFFASLPGGSITFKPDAVITSIKCHMQYYQSN